VELSRLGYFFRGIVSREDNNSAVSGGALALALKLPPLLRVATCSWEKTLRLHMNEPPTNTTSCRDCALAVSLDAVTCPHCGAPRPAQATWNGEGFEWKSRALWMGAPVLHIAFGIAPDGKLRTARGLVAIGQRAVGGLAIGIIAQGFIACGVVSFGVFSCGVVAIAAVGALGVNAIAPIAWGVAALGFQVGGLAPFGWRILWSPSS
jgi:hypothetical protein